MKVFIIQFVSRHTTLVNRRVKMKAEAKSLERLLPRIKKILNQLDKIPNPHEHGVWGVDDIEEVL